MKKILYSLLFVLASFNFAFGQTVLVSHKGVWKDHVYGQNTYESLSKAIAHGFKGIEFDVQLTKDNRLVLAHDNKITRISNCKGAISELSLSKLLSCKVTHNTLLPISQLLVKKVKKPTPFVSFSKVMQSFLSNPKVKFVWIDFKVATDNSIDALENALANVHDLQLLSKIVVNSVDAKALTKVKNRLPQIATSLEGKWGSEPLSYLDEFIQGIDQTHNAISLNVGLHLGHRRALSPFRRSKEFWKLLKIYVQETKALGIPTIGWTVNKKSKLLKLKELNLEYLLTDRIQPLW